MSTLQTLRDTLASAIAGRKIMAVTPYDFPDGIVLTKDEVANEKKILVARKYYDGDHEIKLTDRQKAWLDLHNGIIKFNINHCSTIIDAVVERLEVTGFDVTPRGLSDDLEDESEVENFLEISRQLWSWWVRGRLDAISTEAHRMAVRDGESFILIDYNVEEDLPEYIVHPRFTAKSMGGDGYGIIMYYPNDNFFMDPIKAIKYWSEDDVDDPEYLVFRKTEYYPDRILKYRLNDKKNEWVPTTDAEDEPWPLPWVGDDNKPLGIPIVHYRNTRGRSEIADIIPIQDSLNKTWLDSLASADETAFRMLFFKGFVPTSDGKDPAADGSNLISVVPGQFIATVRSAEKVGVDVIDPATLEPLMMLEERVVLRMASVSNTPLSRFQTTKQIADDMTLKQQEGPLVGKVQEKMKHFGNSWENLMTLSMRIANQFGSSLQNLDKQMHISTVWASPEVQDEERQANIGKTKKELSVPIDIVWKDQLGYSADQIQAMKQSPEYQSYLRQMEMQEIALATAKMNQATFSGGNNSDSGQSQSGNSNGQAPATSRQT